MDNLSLRYVFDRKKIATNTKQGLLQIEVRINKSSTKKFISTGIKLYKNQVSPKNGFTCINHPNAQIITGKARNIYNNYISEVSGKKVILSNRQKTEQCYVTLLLPIAESILKKYNYLLPKISNQKYNDYLKLIAAGVGINKNITSHTARHTFATFLINKGVPIESVSKALGHANIGMTEHYAKLLGKKVVDDMSRLLL